MTGRVDHVKEVIKHLEKVTASGNSPDRVFEDWLEIVEASLEALPGHLESAIARVPLTDTPETQALFERLHSRYQKGWYWEHFQQAFVALLNSTEDWQDVIGTVYMQFGYPNRNMGQVFTPWNIARLMAEMTTVDLETQVNERIKAGISKSPEAQALLLAGCVLEGEEAQEWFFGRVLPAAAPFIEPFTVLDPCVGSGVMLLAFASCCPRWMLATGLVRFYGVDLDRTCVRMARINMMVYGLNGYDLRCANSLTEFERAKLPEPQASAYAEAKQAEEAGDIERVEQIAVELRAGTYVQSSLFDFANINQ